MSEGVDHVRTERLLCERLTAAHADELRPIVFEPSVLRWLWPEDDPPSAEDFERGLNGDAGHWAKHGFGIWLVRDRYTGAAIGRGGLRWTEATGRPEVEVAWVIVPERRGQGLATELAHAAVRTAFGPLDLDDVIAYTLADNAASRRVMEKTGFTYDQEITLDHLPHVVYRRHR